MWNVVWVILLVVMAFFGTRLMFYQIFWKLAQTANMLEGLSISGKRIVIKKITKNPTKQLRDAINNFLEVFTIEPINLDPFGIVKKIEHIYDLSERKFRYFVKGIAPKLDSESQANLVMGVSGAVSLNQISKIVRHYVETIRKTKNLQLAMVLQMQLPLIERISRALLKGTEALTNGWPIGDSIGSMVAANLIGDSKTKEIEEDVLLARKKIKGKNVLIIKAKGPGGRLGKLGKAVEKLVKRGKIAKLITVDAAAKLEGERTGNIAEGVGVAIGGIGVDRNYIENITTTKEIPLDAIAIKMSQEEAIMPMKLEVLNSIFRVTKLLEDDISKTRERGSIIVVGVGNSSGIGNNKKAVEEAEKQIRKNVRIMKERELQEKKEFRIFTEQ
jgi:hypothetical protein